MRGVLEATWASLCEPFIWYVDGLLMNYLAAAVIG
jgi:hypothetical protein